MKKCSNLNCSEINPQPLTSFSKEKNRLDGLQPRCKKCFLEYRLKNKEKILRQKAIYRNANQNRIAVDLAKRYRENIKKRKEYAAVYGAIYKKEHKEEIAVKKREWRLTNPGKYAAYCAKRRAKKLLATPKWLTKEQYKEIEDIYIEAFKLTEETGIKHEVDHIEPLQGKDRSGLHVPWNLQILTKIENLSKGNK
jgi:hypothetical protein